MNKDAEGFVNQKVCLFRERERERERQAQRNTFYSLYHTLLIISVSENSEIISQLSFLCPTYKRAK